MAQLYREVVLKEKPATSNEVIHSVGRDRGREGVDCSGEWQRTSDLKKTEEVGEPVAGD